MATEVASGLPKLEVSFEDDPRVVQEAAIEDYTRHVMPPTWRVGRLSLIGAWWALASAMFWVIFGSLVALTVGTEDALIGIGASVIIFGAICAVLQRYAAETGTTVNLFSRALFGNWGSVIAPILFCATAIFYATFEGSVIAVVFHQYFGVFSLDIWYLIVVLYSVPLVIGGVRAFLDKFNGFLYPLYIALLITAVVWSGAKYGWHSHWLTYKPAKLAVSGPGWWWAIMEYMGVWIMMMYVWDFARFGKTKDLKFASVVTFGPVFYFLALFVNAAVGIFILFTIPTKGALSETSGVLDMTSMMGIVAVILVWTSQTRINTANFYLASTNAENFFARVFKLKLPRLVWTIIIGAGVWAFMTVDIFSVLDTAIQYQGILIVAWVAIALTYIGWSKMRGVSAEATEWRIGRVPMFNWGGVAAWAAGVACGILLLNVAGSFGATWYPFFTFLTAFAVYGVSLEFARRSWFVMVRPNDPRDEVEDYWAARVRCHSCEKSYVAYEMDRDAGHGKQAICNSCAQASTTFYRAARREHNLLAGSDPAAAGPGVVPAE